MRCRFGLVLLLALSACSSKSDVKTDGRPVGASPPKPTFTLFALAELRGQIGPCGCTSDPLGDIARTSKLVAEARAAGPVLVVDAGGLLYSKSPIPPHLTAQEDLKADLLVATYQDDLGVAAVGLGPMDLAAGPGKVRTARHAVNVTAPGLVIEPPRVLAVGAAQVGVFGVVALGVLGDGVTVSDPVAAGKAAVKQLRAGGAQTVVGLIQASSRKDAVKLMRDIGGIDLGVGGLGAAAPEPERVEPEAQQVGDGWLVVPGNRGQVVSRLEVTERGAGPLADAVGSALAMSKREALEKRLAALDAELAKLQADPGADAAFVATKRREREELAAERARLEKQPLVVPARGSYFTLAQLRIGKQLACATDVQEGVFGYFRAAGEANVKAAQSVPVPAPAKGQPSYVGGEACGDCHEDAVTFWQQTRHEGAWETLEQRGQQFDFDCIGCHVTGWTMPGGSNLGFNEPLRDVQCETCHGPGSIHVEQGGEEKTAKSVWVRPPQEMCAQQCHTVEHSDTFEYTAYMRDIVGPGHGEPYRKTLGDGPTGSQLRKAALDKAGRTLGAGCTK